MNFTIEKFSSGWAPIYFEAGTNKFQINTSYGVDSFTDLANGLLFLWNNKFGCQHIYFELESDGWVDLLIINYPNGLLKLEFYDCVTWFTIGENDENPLPVFSCLASLYQFTYLFCREMKKHDEETYKQWGHPFPALQLLQLNKKLLPPPKLPKL